MSDVEYPAYLEHPRRLPKAGPDRVRFCVWYGEAIADGKNDEDARNHAFGCLQLMYFYILGGLGDKIGVAPGDVLIEHLGEGP